MEAYAQRHGRDTETALDQVPQKALEWERIRRQEALEGMRGDYEDAFDPPGRSYRDVDLILA